MDETAARLLGFLLSSLVGGGVASAAGFALLKDRLRNTFATTEDLDAVGGKVTGAISMASMAKDTADANAANIIRLQEGERHRWEPVLRHMERTDKRMDKHEQLLTRLTTMMDEISKRFDRFDGRQ